ncbi:MAG: hypothetical protein ABMB14_19240, partial [Myxococcota bacterium]
VTGVGRVLGAAGQAVDPAAIRAIPGILGVWEPRRSAVVRVSGPPEGLDAVAAEVREALVSAGFQADDRAPPPRPSREVAIDPAAAARLALAPGDVADGLAALVDGLPGGVVADGEDRLPVTIRFGPPGVPLDALTLPTPGGPVPVATVATVTAGIDRPITRIDQRRVVEWVTDAPADAAVRVAEVALPPGYRTDAAALR